MSEHKTILFDGIATQPLPHGMKFHGGSELAKQVLYKAIEFGYTNFDIVFDKARPIHEDMLSIIQENDIKIYLVENNEEVYHLLAKNNYRIFYSAQPLRFTDYNSNAHFFMVIHGLRSIELPWDAYRIKYYNSVLLKFVSSIISRSIKLQAYLKKKHLQQYKYLLSIKNSRIITDSKHSKYAIIYNYPFLSVKDIMITYCSAISAKNCNDYIGNNKGAYYLLLGAHRWEKNICRAIEVFDDLFTKGFLKDKSVTITGCTNECKFLKSIKNKSRFQLLDYVPEDELNNLYRNAFCFVYPSLNEGFGIPPLRAMSYGTPVIASSCTSVPEVCGDAVLYFQPKDKDELANRILQIFYDKDLYSELVKKGFVRHEYYQEYYRQNIHKEIDMIFGQAND
jgi:glycosyltransferase involved in cell wall biosynthesis